MALVSTSGKIKISAQGGQIRQELDAIRRKHGELKKEIGALQKKAGVAFAVMTGATVGLLKSYGTFQRAQIGLTNDIRQMGASANITAIQIQTMASKLQDTLNISDDVGIKTATTLLRSGKLTTDQLERATIAAADIAATYGKDITSVTDQLAQVFANPIEGLTQLKSISKATVTQMEMDMLRSLVEQGKTAEAHAVLLDKIAETTSGAAAARADDLLGVFTNISNSIGDIVKMAGKTIWEDWGFMFRAVRDWLVKIKGEESGVSKTLGKFVVIGTVAAGLVGTLTTLGIILSAIRVGLIGMGVAANFARGKFLLMWGAATFGVAAVIGYFPEIIAYLKEFRLLDKITTSFKLFGNAVSTTFTGILLKARKAEVAVKSLLGINTHTASAAVKRLSDELIAAEKNGKRLAARLRNLSAPSASNPHAPDSGGGTAPAAGPAAAAPAAAVASASAPASVSNLTRLQQKAELAELKRHLEKRGALEQADIDLRLQKKRLEHDLLNLLEMEKSDERDALMREHFVRVQNHEDEAAARKAEKEQEAYDRATATREERNAAELTQIAEEAAAKKEADVRAAYEKEFFELSDEEWEQIKESQIARFDEMAGLKLQKSIDAREEEVKAKQKKLQDDTAYEKKHGAAMLALRRFSENSQVQGFKKATSELATLQNHRSRTLRTIGKASAIVNTIMSTIQGVQEAVTSNLEAYPAPFNAAAAAAAAAAQLAAGYGRVATIKGLNAGGIVAGDSVLGDRFLRALTPGELVVPQRGGGIDAYNESVIRRHRDFGDTPAADREPIDVNLVVEYTGDIADFITLRQDRDRAQNV